MPRGYPPPLLPVNLEQSIKPKPLEKDQIRLLERYLGDRLRDFQRKSVESLLAQYKLQTAFIEATTPANIIAALLKAKRKKSVAWLLPPNSGIDDETRNALALASAQAQGKWEPVAQALDKCIAAHRDHRKLHSAHHRALEFVALGLGFVYRWHHGLLAIKLESGKRAELLQQGIEFPPDFFSLNISVLERLCGLQKKGIHYGTMEDGSIDSKVLREPKPKEKLNCRKFVSTALTAVGIEHPNPEHDPQRLDALIWPAPSKG